MAALSLRDRDAIVTKEGLIFRVFGYSHPSNAYICDAEYSSSQIFKSNNPKAPRSRGQQVFYKFYEDEGFRFVRAFYPQYLIFHEMLGKDVVGVNRSDIVAVKKPGERLKELMSKTPQDELVAALHNALDYVMKHSNLSADDFGVFGSLLHDFYHPEFSDLDFVVYSREKFSKLHQVLRDLYDDECSLFTNEFETDEAVKRKSWRFHNYSPEEYVWHQRRKLIYSLFRNEKRIIKAEFEPVKEWKEIRGEYDSKTKVLPKGWVKIFARVTEDYDAPFIPSVYGIAPSNVLHGAKETSEATRIISYMEEFRMQACRDEKVYVEGNLEEVITPEGSFYQISLTYCPRYYEQTLKVVS